MRHNPTWDKKRPRDGLPKMRRFNAPNVVILTRAAVPPVPALRESEADNEEGRDSDQSAALGTKKELRGMSSKSSLNLARLLSTLDWDKHGICVHVTLTYRHTWPRGKQGLYLTKDALCHAFKREGACGIWRLEFQERGAPHFHCLLWIGARCVNDFEAWCRDWWGKHSGNSHPRAVKVTTGTAGRASWYLALHAAKRAQSPPFAVGRWWGYVDREKFLSAVDLNQTGDVTERERVWWCRLYRRRTGVRTRNNQGLSWFLPLKWQWEVHAWVTARVALELAERHRPKDPF